MTFSKWDIILALGVCLQAAALAYFHHPKLKALLYAIPLPFTLATLTLGRPVDATNVTGLLVLFIYFHAIRLMYPRVPIIPAIVLSATGYCLIGTGMAKILPPGKTAFWLSCCVAIVFSLVVHRLQPARKEPGHRTSLPVWVKAPLILLVVAILVALKKHLGGFMTVFPMVGVIAAYEARYSLWTLGRQLPILIFGTVPLMATVRLAQDYRHFGLGPALLLGWVVFLAIIIPLTRDTWQALTLSSGTLARLE